MGKVEPERGEQSGERWSQHELYLSASHQTVEVQFSSAGDADTGRLNLFQPSCTVIFLRNKTTNSASGVKPLIACVPRAEGW